MSGRLTWDGMTEFREALRRLPEELKAEGESLVKSTAELTVSALKATYPARLTNLHGQYAPGGLRRGVSSFAVFGNAYGVRYLVVNSAPHALLYEKGTQARLYYSKVKGVRHYTGRMPPHPVFLPAIRRAQRRLDDQLADLLQRHGLLVLGRAA